MNVRNISPDLTVLAKGPSAAGQGEPAHEFVGSVDHMDGENHIKLKRSDSPDGEHHWIPTDWVERVDEDNVYLSKTVDEFNRGLLDSPPMSKSA